MDMTYEIIGWRALLKKAGTAIDDATIAWIDVEFNGLVLTRAGARWFLTDLVEDGVLIQDIVLLGTTGFAGNAHGYYTGGIQAAVWDISFEDTFLDWWSDIAKIAWRQIDDSKHDEVCFATLWTYETIVFPATWLEPEEYDVDVNLVGVVDMGHVKVME